MRQLAGYAASAAFALGVDLCVLWSLVSFSSVPYLVAATISYTAGACVVYWLSIRLAFTEHRMSNRAAEFTSFVAIGLLGLVVNAYVMEMAVRLLGLHVMIAKCCAAACTFMCNFVVRRHLLFVRARGDRVREMPHD